MSEQPLLSLQMLEENGRSRLAEWIALTNQELFGSRLAECKVDPSTVKKIRADQSQEEHV